MPNMKVAVSPNGCIYFPKQSCPADFALADRSYRIWLIHELTHVWQYQQGFRTWLAGLHWHSPAATANAEPTPIRRRNKLPRSTI